MKSNTIRNAQTSRRAFLKSSSGVVLLLGASGILPQLVSCKNIDEVAEQLEKYKLTAWVQISEDGHITIYNPAAEMGQGSMTSLPAIFAEEMDADWNKVRVEFSPQESSIYGSDGWGPNRKIMLSAGSRVTKGYYNLLRKAGAQARYILMHSVSKKWDVPITELSTEPNLVVHKAKGEKMDYGEIVPFLEMPEDLPGFTENELKNPKDFRFIGKDLPRTDIPSKIDGSAEFAIDVRLPNMLYGVIQRGRTHKAKPELQNEDEIRSMEGIVNVVQLEHGIGVIARRIEKALEAKKRLKIKWSKTEMSGLNSQELYSTYKKVVREKKKGDVVTDEGNFRNALKRSSKIYNVDFKNDYVYHAQMEPLNAVVQLSLDGQSAEAWVGSQQGFDSKLGIPQVLGLEPDQVNIHLKYLGGGFGRRSMTDFVTECALLAKESPGRPVKLMWTREDDITYGAYRPLSLQRLTAFTNAKGELDGLSHIIVGDGNRLLASGIKNEFYNIPNQYAEIKIVPSGVRLKHWRAVGHGPNKFAIESMIDIIAHDQGKDPIEFRKRLMSNSPRALATLTIAEEMSKWAEPAIEGRAKGVAFLERSGTLSTGICEISVDQAIGKIKVHNFWSANDAGVVIQPDNVKAQLEGGIIMGMSSVFKEQVTIENGEVQQSNFDDYQLLRMEDIPDTIETAIIQSNESPQGVGESGTPLVAGAVANAFLKLTGKRLTHLPFTPARVLEVLNG